MYMTQGSLSNPCVIYCMYMTQGSLSNPRGGPFAILNGAMVRDAVAVVVPKGVTLEAPIHILYLSTGGCGCVETG
jgi:hypothetical protein